MCAEGEVLNWGGGGASPFVPKEKNSALVAMSPAVSAALGVSIIVPTRYSTVVSLSSWNGFEKCMLCQANLLLETAVVDERVNGSTVRTAKAVCGGF